MDLPGTMSVKRWKDVGPFRYLFLVNQNKNLEVPFEKTLERVSGQSRESLWIVIFRDRDTQGSKIYPLLVITTILRNRSRYFTLFFPPSHLIWTGVFTHVQTGTTLTVLNWVDSNTGPSPIRDKSRWSNKMSTLWSRCPKDVSGLEV